MRTVLLYMRALLRHFWFLLSSAVLTLISMYANSRGHDWVWTMNASKWAAFGMFFVAGYLAWRDEHRRANDLIAKRVPTMAITELHAHPGQDHFFFVVRLVNPGEDTSFNDDWSVEIARPNTTPVVLRAAHWGHARPFVQGAQWSEQISIAYAGTVKNEKDLVGAYYALSVSDLLGHHLIAKYPQPFV